MGVARWELPPPTSPAAEPPARAKVAPRTRGKALELLEKVVDEAWMIATPEELAYRKALREQGPTALRAPGRAGPSGLRSSPPEFDERIRALQSVLGGVARGLAWGGEFERGAQVAAEIEDLQVALRPKMDIARLLLAEGRAEEATEAFENVFKAGVTSRGGDAERGSPLSEIALALAPFAQGGGRADEVYQEVIERAAKTFPTGMHDVPGPPEDPLLMGVIGALAGGGYYSLALDAVQHLQGSAQRRKALSGVACSLINAGYVEQGLKLVPAIEAEKDREGWPVHGLDEVARSLIMVGQLDQALEVLKGEGGSIHAQTLFQAGKELAEAGRRDEALAVLDQAAKAAGKDPDYARSRVLWELGSPYAELGDREKALEIVKQGERNIANLKNPNDRPYAYYNVVGQFLKMGELDEALRVAKKIETGPWMVDVEAIISGPLAEAGRDEEAIQAIGEALRRAKVVKQEEEARGVKMLSGAARFDLGKAAGHLIVAGPRARSGATFRKIVEMIEQTTEPYSRCQYLSEASKSFVRVGEEQQARLFSQRASRSLREFADSETALRELSKTFNDLGYGGPAEDIAYLAEKIAAIVKVPGAVLGPQEMPGEMAVTYLAKGLCKAGQFNRALSLVDGITGRRSERLPALRGIARAMVAAGLVSEAIRGAQRRKYEQEKAEMLASIGVALAEKGEFDAALDTLERALEVAHRLTRPLEKTALLSLCAYGVGRGFGMPAPKSPPLPQQWVLSWLS